MIQTLPKPQRVDVQGGDERPVQRLQACGAQAVHPYSSRTSVGVSTDERARRERDTR